MTSLSTRALVASAAALSLTLAGLVVAESAAAATTITVTTVADGDANGACAPGSTQTTTATPVTLRNALCVASNLGGEATITVPGGDYTLTDGALQYGEHPGSDLLLTGVPGDQANLIGNGSTQILTLDPDIVGGIDVEITEVRFNGGRDGVYGGGAIIGGSLDQAAPDTLNVHNSRFIDNATTIEGAPGGAIQFIGGDLTVKRVAFEQNDGGSSSGGAVYYEARRDGDALTITGSQFDGNHTQPVNGMTAGGGAIAFTADGAAGSIADATFTITENRFRGNEVMSPDGTASPGGAVYQLDGSATVSENTFDRNKSGLGAASLHAENGTLAANYNSFSRSIGTVAVRTTSTTQADLTNNWWGCNTGANSPNCETADVQSGTAVPYITMTAGASQSTVEVGGTVELTISLGRNSAGDLLSSDYLAAVDALSPTWESVAPAGSSVSPMFPVLTNGEAAGLFTAGSTGGVGGATVRLGNTTVSVPITVTQPVAFTSAATTSGQTGQPFTFTIQASGYPAPTLVPLVGTLPPGLQSTPSGSSILISGTPTAPGSYTLMTAASNGGALVPHALTITIGAAPALTPPATATVAAGDPVDVTLTATGSPTPTITATGVPAGLTLDDNGDGTAHLHGTPTVAPGEYALTLTLANAIDTVSTPFTLVITADAAITSTDHTTFTAGTAGSFPVTTSDGFPVTGPTSLVLLDAPAWLTLSGSTLVGTPPAGSGGVHTFHLRFTGATVAEQFFTLTVNEAPVVTTQPSSTAVVTGTDAVFTAAASGYPAPTVQWQRFISGSWKNLAGATSGTLTLPTTLADDGARVRAVFTNSTSSTASAEAVLSVGTLPKITAIAAQTTLAGAPFTFTVSATGTPPAELTVTGMPAWMGFVDNGDGTGAFTGTPTLSDVGSSAISITADNGYGVDDATLALNVIGAIPSFTSPLYASVDRGDPVDVTISAFGIPTPTILAPGVLPGGLTLTDNGDGTARLHGTPTVAPGVHTFGLTITNTLGDSSADFTLTVNATPSFLSPDEATFTVGTEGAHTLAVDPGHPVHDTVSMDGAPAWLTLDGAAGAQRLTGTPPAGSGGEYEFELSIDGSTATQEFTLTVNEAPVITAQPESVTLIEGADAVFDAAAAGYPKPTAQWQRLIDGVWTDLPGETEATLTFTPTLDDDGAEVRVLFSNAAGETVSATATLAVRTPPTLDAVAPLSVLAGAAVAIDITSSGFPDAVLTATGLPAWLAFADAGDGTATLTGTPGADDAGTVTITVAADNGFGTAETTVRIDVAASVPLPGTLPDRADGTLSGVPETVEREQRITVGGTGFLPGSTVRLGMYSAPTVLGSPVVDENGAFTAVVTIPLSQSLGAHTVAASGIAADGTPLLLTAGTTVIEKTVVTPPTPRPEEPKPGTGGLPATGLDAHATTALALFALLVLLAGAALIRVSRRGTT